MQMDRDRFSNSIALRHRALERVQLLKVPKMINCTNNLKQLLVESTEFDLIEQISQYPEPKEH